MGGRQRKEEGGREEGEIHVHVCMYMYYDVHMNECASSLPLSAPLIERRKYNTLEKTLHNLLEDEAILLQMSSSASSLHSPHQELHTILQEMLGSLRDVMSIKRQEMDNLQLPHERARVDITIHDR